MLWSERVKKLMRERELTQIEMAERIGYSYQGFNRLLSGRDRSPTLKSLRLIAEELGVSVEYLQSGVDRPTGSPNTTMAPVLSDHQIKSWIDSPESLPKESFQWLTCPVETQSQKTFAYILDSDDMVDATGRMSITPGSVVFIEPDRAMEKGSIVAAIVNECLVIRELQQIAGQWLLTPANSKYKALPMSDARYTGRAVAFLNIL